MKTSYFLLIMLVGAGLGACEEMVAVSVKCGTTWAPAVECDVSETFGKREVVACWDFSVTCANGNRVTAERTCQKLKGGGTVKTMIPAGKLTGYDRCGGEGSPVSAVTRLTIDGEPVG
jgi:hypothetical protein